MLNYKALLTETAIAFVVIILMDFIWLGFIAKNFYTVQIGDLAVIEDGKMKVNLAPGLIVYLFLAIGISYFVLGSSDGTTSLLSIFFKGAVFGLLTYGVYDLTNMATLRHWSIPLALADMGWGTFVCGVGALATRLISEKIL